MSVKGWHAYVAVPVLQQGMRNPLGGLDQSRHDVQTISGLSWCSTWILYVESVHHLQHNIILQHHIRPCDEYLTYQPMSPTILFLGPIDSVRLKLSGCSSTPDRHPVHLIVFE